MSTLGAVWRDVQHRLKAAGIDPAPREGRLLVAHVLGIGEHDLTLKEADLFPYEKKDFLEKIVARRVANEPLAYVLGYAPFWSRDWRVSRDVLIPRPDTEVLLRAVLTARNKGQGTRNKDFRFAEVGVGSGALVGSLLMEWLDAKAVGTDISPPALSIATQNLAEAGVAARCTLVEADLLDGVEGPFDLIVSNPPYIGESEWAALEPGVRDFEPRMALVADNDGLAVYARLIVQAAAKLAPGGALCLEIGWQQGPAVTALLQQQQGPAQPWTDIQLLQDLAGRDRVVCAHLRL